MTEEEINKLFAKNGEESVKDLVAEEAKLGTSAPPQTEPMKLDGTSSVPLVATSNPNKSTGKTKSKTTSKAKDKLKADTAKETQLTLLSKVLQTSRQSACSNLSSALRPVAPVPEKPHILLNDTPAPVQPAHAVAPVEEHKESSPPHDSAASSPAKNASASDSGSPLPAAAAVQETKRTTKRLEDCGVVIPDAKKAGENEPVPEKRRYRKRETIAAAEAKSTQKKVTDFWKSSGEKKAEAKKAEPPKTCIKL